MISINFLQRTVLFLLVVVFLAMIAFRVKWIFLPIADIGGIEQNIVYSIQRFLSGNSFYTEPESIPFTITQYTPLYYCVVSGMASAMFLTADDLLELFRLNRSISLVLNLCSLVAIWYIARNRLAISRSVALAIVVTAVFYMERHIYGRPDSLFHVLFFMSIYQLLGSLESKSFRSLLLAGCYIWVCIWSKQTGIVLIPIWMLAWYLTRATNRFYASLVVFITIGLVFLTLSQLIWTDLLSNVVGGVNNGIDIRYFIETFKDHLEKIAIWIVAGVGISGWYWVKKGRSDLQVLLSVGCMALLVFSFMTSLKWGSNVNYFTEYITLSMLMLGYAVQSEYKQDTIRQTANIILILMLFSYSTVRFVSKIWTGNVKNDYSLYQEEKAISNQILTSIDPDKYVLIFDSKFIVSRGFLGNLLHKNVIMNPKDIIDCCAYKTNDYSRLQTLIDHGKVQFIITKGKELPKTYLGATITDRFTLSSTNGDYSIYSFSPLDAAK